MPLVLNKFMQCQYLGQYFLYLPASVAPCLLSDCLLPELEAVDSKAADSKPVDSMPVDSMPVDSMPADYTAGYSHIHREADSTVAPLEHPVI